MTNMRLWVLDTNILVSYYCFRGATISHIVDHALDHRLLAFSEATFQEFEQVLCRGKFDTRATLQERMAFIERLDEAGHFFPIHERFSILQDKADNHFLDIAQAAQAEYLVTGDKALLGLAKCGKTAIVSPFGLYERLGA